MNKDRQELYRKALMKRQLIKDKRVMDKFLSDKKSLNAYIQEKMSAFRELPAITDSYNNLELTYGKVEEQMNDLASALQYLGTKKGDFVGIFSENNGRWAICDQAVMRCGAVCTLRGSNAPLEELDYIIGHSGAVGLILKDGKLFNSLKSIINNYFFKYIIIMFKSENDDLSGVNCPVYHFDDVLKTGKENKFVPVEQNIEDVCSMLYTSGTTGNPKGVLISHRNILAQFPSFIIALGLKSGENTLQVLPVWHSYENATQLYFFSGGSHLHFTNPIGLRSDLTKYNIDILFSVPRIWETLRLAIFQKLKQKSHFKYRLFDFGLQVSITYKIHKMYSERRITNKKNGYKSWINFYHRAARLALKPVHLWFTEHVYSKIKKELGIDFKYALSGGGSLSLKDQIFYDAIGVNLREGYGLTETSPVLTLRYIDEPNFLGSCGRPIMGTEIKILDIESGKELGIFQKGIVHVRGYQVMSGYYKNEEATKAVLTDDGWFNTGDIGWLTADNNLVLVGRMKETIVLSNGENVEPIPIEEACLESPYIDQMVLVGQDKSSIGALIVPSEAALEKCGILAKDLKSGKNLEIKDQTLRDLMKREISTYIKNKKNLKSFEQIKQFEILKDNFTSENGMLSQTSKLKRNNIFEKYKAIISNMFEKKQ